jgi:quinol monooxygenase YgiN
VSQLRVVISVSYPTVEQANQELDQLRAFMPFTLKHRGCLQFEAFQSITEPRNIILLEMFESLAAYDEHHRSRLSGRDAGTLPPLSERWMKGMREGTIAEFYRHDLYKLVDDRWVPVNQARRSATIECA